MKEHILTGANQLFGQYGFKSVTMDDIAKHLGISKRTIYQYYKDKDALVHTLMEAKFTAHECEWQVAVKNGNDAVHEMLLSLDSVNDWLTSFNPKLFYDLQKYHPAAWLKYRDFKETYLAIGIANNLQRGIDEGIYRADLEIEVLTAIRLNHGQLIFKEADHFTRNNYTISQVLLIATQHFLYGVCNAKGQKLLEKYSKQINIKS